FLVQRLEDPNTKKDSAIRLARFKDKRAVPILMEMLASANDYTQENILESLIKIGDKSCIPSIMGDKKTMFTFINVLARQEHISPEFGMAVVDSLLKLLEGKSQSEGWQLQDRILDILRNIKNPSLAPIYGELFLESERGSPFQNIAYLLADMGTDGIPYLFEGTKLEKTHRIAFNALGSYNDKIVVYEINQLALNRFYPFRITAIDTLANFGYIWRKSIMSTLVTLMRERDPKVKLHALRVIERLELREMAGIIRPLANDKDQQVKTAVVSILDNFSNKPPIKLEIKLNKKSYGYDKPIIMEYRITNSADYDIYVSKHGAEITDAIYGTAIEPPEIFKSNDEPVPYNGPAVDLGTPNKESYQILKPGDSISGKIDITKFYEIYQPGFYTIKLRYQPIGDGIDYGIWSWKGKLVSNEVTFKIRHPSRWHYMKILRNARISNADEEITFYEASKACKKLGELKSKAGISDLKKIAFYKFSDDSGIIKSRKEELSYSALTALAKTESRILIPDWLKLLKDDNIRKREIAIDALVRLKHPTAIEILKHQVFDYGSSPAEPALKLKELGYNDGIEWINKIMPKRIKHWNIEVSFNAVITLQKIHSIRGIRDALTSKELKIREAGYSWIQEVAEDLGINRLTEMLKDIDPNVKKASAYQLARLGNASGLELIKQDLDAVNSEIRKRAKSIIIELYKNKIISL
ncbi:MAG: HEAT repeat domain-containing protein, partial [Candidatus Poribacteria bacterium]